MTRVLSGSDRHRGLPVNAAGGGNIFRAHRSVNLRACVALALIMAAACTPSRAIRTLPPATATNAGHAPFADEHVPADVEVEWDMGVGRGLPVSTIVQQDLVIAVVSGGGIVTASASTGRRYWTRRFDGSVAGHALRSGNRIYFTTQHRNGSAYALDLYRGRRLWSHRLGSSAATEPALANGRLFATTQRGEVIAFDTANGEPRWRTRIGSAAVVAPLVSDHGLIVATRDTLVTLDPVSGTVLARHPIAGAPSARIVSHGDTLFIAMYPGIVSAYVDGGARELWRHAVDAPVLAAPVVADDGVYVLTRNADLLRVTAYGITRIVSLDAATTESLTLAADGALIGTLDGRVVYVRKDGTIVWEERVNGSVRAPAVVRDSDVFVSTLRGRLVKFSGG